MLRRIRIIFILLVMILPLFCNNSLLMAASLDFEHNDEMEGEVSSSSISSQRFSSDEDASFEKNLIGDDFFSSAEEDDDMTSLQAAIKVHLPNEQTLSHIINKVCFYPHLKEKTDIHKNLADTYWTAPDLLDVIQEYWDSLLGSKLNSVEFALFKMQREYMILAIADEILKENPVVLEDLKKSQKYQILTEQAEKTRERVFHQWRRFFKLKDERGM